MAEPSTYNYEDIERYLQHKMSAQEMHAFERAMMDDPFLADAIEGYKKANSSISETHLSEIEKQLKGEKQGAKIVPLPLYKRSWLKTAAIVLIIVFGAAISYILLNNKQLNKNEQQIAQAKPNELQVEKDSNKVELALPKGAETLNSNSLAFNKPRTASPAHDKDRVATPTITSIKEQQESQREMVQSKDQVKEESMVSASPKQTVDTDFRLMARRSMLAPIDTIPQALLAKVAGAEISSRKNTRTKQNEFKGIVTDTTGKSIPFATVKISNSNASTTTSATGNFSIKGPDNVLQIDASSVGFDRATTKLKSNITNNQIVLQPNNNSLNEVVVTGYGKQKKTDVTGSVTQITEATPQGGWGNFQNYINTQIKRFQDSTGVKCNSNITLEFSLNKAGRPVRIKAKNEANKGAIIRAKQILKNGPDWISGKTSKVKVTMAF